MRTSCAVLPSAVASLSSERQYFSEAARRIAGADYVVALPLELDCNEICAGTHSWSYDDNRSRETRVLRERRGVTWTRTTPLGTYRRLGPAGAMREKLRGLVRVKPRWDRAAAAAGREPGGRCVLGALVDENVLGSETAHGPARSAAASTIPLPVAAMQNTEASVPLAGTPGLTAPAAAPFSVMLTQSVWAKQPMWG